jgi:hypothetical protein
MADLASQTDRPQPGLVSRILGVITSPRETYAAVAAHPRVLGVLLATALAAAGTQYLFLSSESGKKAALDAIDSQIAFAESLGATVTDEAYDGMVQSVDRAPYWGAVSALAGIPIYALVLAAVFMGIFNGILGGEARFKQVCAAVAHAGVIWTLGIVFTAVLGLFTGTATGATRLSVFFPMLETGFWTHLFRYVDIFWLWGFTSVATGLGVLYKRSTGAIAVTLIGVYLTIGIGYAIVRSFLGA